MFNPPLPDWEKINKLYKAYTEILALSKGVPKVPVMPVLITNPRTWQDYLDEMEEFRTKTEEFLKIQSNIPKLLDDAFWGLFNTIPEGVVFVFEDGKAIYKHSQQGEHVTYVYDEYPYPFIPNLSYFNPVLAGSIEENRRYQDL